MNKYPKYVYPKPIPVKNRKWPDNQLEKAPAWCSVDLRDGNQALPIPMTPEKKLRYFKMLFDIGFKEIEVGFPSASQDDFDFTRKLIAENHVPKGVRISVLTQARKHLIDRTVESLAGVKEAIIHCYVATSDLHGSIVFDKNREDVKKMSVEGTRMIVKAIEKAGLKNIAYEFSPEEFTDTDIDFAIEICEAVKEAWGKSEKNNFILNLPATVERRPPYQYADMIEYFIGKYKYMDETTISVHAHNDQGCAVASTEMALLAGADRVEGTLFGHGERTGNVDLVTLALNIHSRGIRTNLNFSDLNSIVKVVESASGIPVHQRHPYAGELVFTAFSGSHQDAIRKGLNSKKKAEDLFHLGWKVPYLHIDPADVGRKYERLIRINSQSGKGGAVFILEQDFGFRPPKEMHPEIGDAVQAYADKKKKEITSDELLDVFKKEFIDIKGPYGLDGFHIISERNRGETVRAKISVTINGTKCEIEGEGNGPVSATVHALKTRNDVIGFIINDFSEQSMGQTADATAVAYVSVKRNSDGKIFYGVGIHSNIEQAALRAVFAALNKAASN
ncbi:MAG: 2-isopropylmalate synthase [Victivallales bacterium]